MCKLAYTGSRVQCSLAVACNIDPNVDHLVCQPLLDPEASWPGWMSRPPKFGRVIDGWRVRASIYGAPATTAY